MKKMSSLLLTCSVAAMCWQPIFEEYETVKIGGQDFKDAPVDLWGDGKFRGYPAPTMVDYNGDGLDDLVVGIFDKGAIMMCENVGTKKEPKFDDFKILENKEKGVSFAKSL